MLSITSCEAFYLVPLLLFLIVMATGAYKKSYSLLVISIALVLAGFAYKYDPLCSLGIMSTAVFILTLRSIYNHKNDMLVKR